MGERVMVVEQTAAAEAASCPVCGGPVVRRAGRGRPRVYCSASCRQQAYEDRNGVSSYRRRRGWTSQQVDRQDGRLAKVLEPSSAAARRAEDRRRYQRLGRKISAALSRRDRYELVAAELLVVLTRSEGLSLRSAAEFIDGLTALDARRLRDRYEAAVGGR